MINDTHTPEDEQDENKNIENEDEETNEGSDEDTSDDDKSSDQSKKDDDKSEDKDWKAEAAKWKAIAERGKKKPAQQSSKKSDGFDYGEKAFLASNGIKGTAEIEFTRKIQKETGKDLDVLLETTYYQTELAEFREKRSTEAATPTGTKRSNNSSIDTVEYWIAKGELPPVAEVELRRKVVNARLKKDEKKGVFYNS